VTVLGIHVLGSAVLRQETEPVTVVTDDIRRLIDDMFETMYAARGIGLAAPQVGRTERVTVVDVDREGNCLHPIALINPTILLREGSARGEEGCLSIPEIFGDVERAVRVVVRALDRDGRQFEIDATELLARCLQHEIDHLHGKLFIDYLSIFKRRAALAKWEEEKEKYPTLVRAIVPASAIADLHDSEREDEEM
jgi:peptide deformylase